MILPKILYYQTSWDYVQMMYIIVLIVSIIKVNVFLFWAVAGVQKWNQYFIFKATGLRSIIQNKYP